MYYKNTPFFSHLFAALQSKDKTQLFQCIIIYLPCNYPYLYDFIKQ